MSIYHAPTYLLFYLLFSSSFIIFSYSFYLVVLVSSTIIYRRFFFILSISYLFYYAKYIHDLIIHIRQFKIFPLQYFYLNYIFSDSPLFTSAVLSHSKSSPLSIYVPIISFRIVSSGFFPAVGLYFSLFFLAKIRLHLAALISSSGPSNRTIVFTFWPKVVFTWQH